MYSHKAFNDFWWKFLFSLKEFLIALSVIGSNQYYINFLCWGSQGIHTIQPLSLRSDYVTQALTLVFCCIVAWIQPDISGCQQDFLAVWRWNQFRTIKAIFYRFSRGCKPPENLCNCPRKYTKMFKTDSFVGNKKCHAHLGARLADIGANF